MVSAVETMRRLWPVPSSLTMTERGLRWFLLGLSLALAAWLLSLGVLFAVIAVQTWSLLFLVEDAVGLAVIALGLVGFWRMRQGRVERGPAHASSLRRATIALILAAVSEGSILVSGIILGYGILPRAILIGDSYPVQITPYWILRMVHFTGYALVAIFVGLFLLWSIWHLVTGVPRGIAVAALVALVPAPLISLVSVSQLLDPFAMPVVLYGVALVLPALSISLWLIAYILAILRLRSGALVPLSGAASN